MSPRWNWTSAEERFWAKVEKTATCWEWTGSVGGSGYGNFSYDGRTTTAHRVAYEWLIGDPSGKQVDHLCHNRRCVNPAHLRLVTPKENRENLAGANRNSRSGVRGVSWNAKAGKWKAQVRSGYKVHFLGYFEDLAVAELAASEARRRLFTHSDMDQAKSTSGEPS